VLAFLPDGPRAARWLSAEDRRVIETRLAPEPAHIHQAFWPMLGDARVWALALPDFGIVLSTYGLGLWLPQIVKGMGFSNLGTGFTVALVYGLSSVVSVLWCLSSDRAGERVRHVAVAAVLGACGLFAAAFLQGSLWCIAALGVGMAGTLAAISVFWALPSSFLRGTAAAGGIALINSLANLGGFAGPYLMGWLKAWSGGYSAGFAALGCGLIMTAILILLLGRSLGFTRRAHRFDKFAPPL